MLSHSADRPKAVIVDGWWQREDGLEYCKRQRDASLQWLCSDDSIGQKEYVYSAELMAKLSANKDCSGFVVHYFSGAGGSDAETLRLEHGQYMMLMVDYIADRDDLWWSMSGHRQNSPYQAAAGHGTPKEIAETVCAIVSNPRTWKE